MEFVSWDDEIPNIWNNKIHVPNHQPAQQIWPSDIHQAIFGDFPMIPWFDYNH